MDAQTLLAPHPLLDPKGYARWHWEAYQALLSAPEEAGEADWAEWGLMVDVLKRLAAHDPEAALSLAREIWDERERLQALGIRLLDWEAWRARLGL